MNTEELKARTRAFALRIIPLAESLPDTPTAKVIRNQMIRCGSSVGELTEPHVGPNQNRISFLKWERWRKKPTKRSYRMELLIDSEIVTRPRIADLLDEADQILSIVISSIKTAKGYRANPQSAIRNHNSYA